MTAMQMTCPGLSPRQAPGGLTDAIAPGDERSLPADKPAIVAAHFQPLDPSILNEAIPAFFIGRNKEGLWVARGVNGQIGGIFLFENSALSFARKKSGEAGCATIYLFERFELDLENEGNPLVAQLGALIRLSRRPRKRWAILIGKAAEAAKRRLKNF